MEAMEEKLSAILSNPEMMQQIMSLAQSLGSDNGTQVHTHAQPENASPPPPIPDLSGLQQLSGLAGKSSIDANQKQLLSALSPYLSTDRVTKLENAMRAAKLAKLASAFLGNGGLQFLNGR